FSAYQTLNHVAAVPRRLRAGFASRYVRVFVMLATLLLGGLAVGALTVVVTALPSVPEAGRALAVLGSAVVISAVLLLGARLLPRALDVNRPTAGDVRAMALLAREQERIPAARVEFRVVSRESPSAGNGSPGSGPP